jgi:hypothetical protein
MIFAITFSHKTNIIMDLAITLIKSVARAFYETRDILVIDALILHEA